MERERNRVMRVIQVLDSFRKTIDEVMCELSVLTAECAQEEDSQLIQTMINHEASFYATIFTVRVLAIKKFYRDYPDSNLIEAEVCFNPAGPQHIPMVRANR